MCCATKLFARSLILFILLKLTKLTNIEISLYANTIGLQDYHDYVVKKFLKERENWTTSVVGDVLYKFKEPIIEPERRKKIFKIFIWKYWFNLNYWANTRSSLKDCSVKNCVLNDKPFGILSSDAVVVWIDKGKIPTIDFGSFRNMKQIRIFYTLESPMHTRGDVLLHSAFEFNWSMTYRSDANIPFPYGRTIPLKSPISISTPESLSRLVPYWNNKQKNVLVASMISNCHIPYRLDLIKKLKQYLAVDFYGKCGDNHLKRKCPGPFTVFCKEFTHYYFYLALENSHCRQYITEKVFHNGYAKGAIPIIKGAPVADCEKLLPPQSYLHVDNFASIEDLAKEIIYISSDEKRLLSYHTWRAHFNVTDEDNGFFSSTSFLCRVCEALNYNSMEPSIYTKDDLELYLNKNIVCDMTPKKFH